LDWLVTDMRACGMPCTEHSQTYCDAVIHGLAAGRLGGDHFVVVQRGRSERQLDQFVGRLKLAAAEVLDPVGAHLVDSQLSIGFAQFPTDADSAESLLLAAARQSYGDKMSKRSGGLRNSQAMQFEAAVERAAPSVRRMSL